MDQHPIPQDVTGFQFKLIGSMTVKQFGYVGAGAISAVVLYYLPFPMPVPFAILLKFLLIPLIGGSGVFIAFVPIEGRPVDVMTTNFFRAVMSPNQYIYKKVGRRYLFSTITIEQVKPVTVEAQQKTVDLAQQRELHKKSARLEAYLRGSQTTVKNELDEREVSFLRTVMKASTPAPLPTITQAATPTTPLPAALSSSSLTSILSSAPPLPQPTPHIIPPAQTPTLPATPTLTNAPLPNNEPQKPNPDSLVQQETYLEQQLIAAKKAEAATKAPEVLTAAHQKVADLEKQMQEIHAQKQRLEEELHHLRSTLPPQPLAAPTQATAQATGQIALTPTGPASPPSQPTQQAQQAAPAPLLTSQFVRNVPQGTGKTVGLPHISDTPNVVVGIVKDPRGNILPNILVEVKDKDGNPVRAFKTNPLGQFASATPLTPGTYTIELEDPKKQHSFDIIQIITNNQILLPIEIISHDAREELRKQLFTN